MNSHFRQSLLTCNLINLFIKRDFVQKRGLLKGPLRPDSHTLVGKTDILTLVFLLGTHRL